MYPSSDSERVIFMKSSKSNRYFVRGAAAPKVIAALGLVLLAGVGGWWFLTQRGIELVPALSVMTEEPVAAPGEALPAISPAVEELSVDQLNREARKAMAEQRLVMPAGNNALEYYLAILEKDSTNAGAKEALRELFPFASGTAEQEINQGDIEEGARIISSLAKADPSNYTLTILRSKLEAKRKQVDQQLALTAAAATAATRAPAASTAATEPAAVEPVATAPTAASPTAIATPTPAPVETRPQASAPIQAAPVGETRDVVVVSPVAPVYPPQAARNRSEGWVEVEFTVTAGGVVEAARVTRSDPPRVFDREAIRSIERSTFRPRLENGEAKDSTVRRRIEFKLGS